MIRIAASSLGYDLLAEAVLKEPLIVALSFPCSNECYND